MILAMITDLDFFESMTIGFFVATEFYPEYFVKCF